MIFFFCLDFLYFSYFSDLFRFFETYRFFVVDIFDLFGFFGFVFGQSPPQELEVSPRSRLYLLVIVNGCLFL